MWSHGNRSEEALEAWLPGFEQHPTIHVTGCLNRCGQHWIADLGPEGKKTKVDGRLVDAYQFSVGGAVGRRRGFARPTGVRVRAIDVPAAIECLLRAYLADRHPGENFRAFCARHSNEARSAVLTGHAGNLDAPSTSGAVPVEHRI